MYLKRLEIQGFKSFPDKIKLDFKKGITAVVGPNGSGKSNISDAIRWVLGEQSAKSLRGVKMEDVIFAGTQNRKPLGFAEVSMIISNEDGMMPIDYSEVAVTRRVYRSGESEFQINGTQCRLKDIHELFMDTGIGKEGYSIIGQGRIDEILSTKSEDRRLLFEEATGIVKYKNRRNEAQVRLERERQNLIRLTDIINELETQLEPLKHQAEKTRRYLALAERFKLVRVNIFINEIDKINSDRETIKEKLAASGELIKDFERNQNLNKNEQADLKQSMERLDLKIESVNAELAELRSAVEQNENDIKLLEQQIEFITSGIEESNGEILKNERFIADSEKEIKMYLSQKQVMELSVFTKKEELNKQQSEFDNIVGRLTERESLIENYNLELIDLIRVTTGIKGVIANIESNVEQSRGRLEQFEKDKAYTENTINDKIVYSKVLERKKQNLLDKEKEFYADIERLTNEKERASFELIEMKTKRDAIYKRENTTKSRYKVLKELQRGHEGYFDSVKAILKQKELTPGAFSGIRGVVGEIIEVPERLETAIEVGLGAAVQNLIAMTTEDAKEAIEYLKRNNKGRATFLPLTSIKPNGLSDTAILKENGVLGIAKDLIIYAKAYENAMCNLLGRLIIVDNLQNALFISKKYGYKNRIVTLEGEILNPGGSLTGGSLTKNVTNIFSRVREIAGLEQDIANIKNELETILAEIESKDSENRKIKEEIQKTQENIQHLKLEGVTLDNDTLQVESAINELNQRLLHDGQEMEKSLAQIREQEQNLLLKTAELNGMSKRMEELQNELSSYQSGVQTDRDVKDEKTRQLTDIKVSIAEQEQALNAAHQNIKRYEDEIKNYKGNIVEYKEKIKELSQQRELKKKEIESLDEDMKNSRSEQSDRQDEYILLGESKKEINKRLEQSAEEAAALIEQIANLKNECTRFELKSEQLEETGRRLHDEMWEEYEITYISAKQYEALDTSFTKIQEEEKQLRGQIKELGSVNVNAIDEFKALSERYEFLTEQRNDIENARENLNNIIKELTGLMEEQFVEQFKIISENFNAVFSEMFGGGTAYLKLTDETDILESGIEIIAQPPGKRLQSMSLLSGGERALTATTLLFAILRMKPSPFCVLDEVEAALDDANVKRYADYIKKFYKKTQFILITHRKGTMEAADVLYGVTMQEQGVSKLVSVNFSDGESA